MKKVIILKTGDTFPAIAEKLGDFEDWIKKGLGIDEEQILIADVAKGEMPPPVESCKGIVITGSHAMVTQDLLWSVAVEKLLPDVIELKIPVLGICYGHQLLARAMGGNVDYHKQGLEIGTTKIKLEVKAMQDKLFKDLPESFCVHTCHSQTVVKLPENAVRLAQNSFEPNHAFRIGENAWGLQFHPEYDETIMKSYAGNMETIINESGLSLSDILGNVKSTPIALEILRRFGKLVK